MNTIIFKICLVRTGPYTHNTTSTKITKLLIGCFTVKAFLEAKWPFRKQRIWRNKQFQVQVRSLGFQKKQLRWANTQGIFKGIWKFFRGVKRAFVQKISTCTQNVTKIIWSLVMIGNFENKYLFVAVVLPGNSAQVIERLIKWWWKWPIPFVLRTRGITSYSSYTGDIFIERALSRLCTCASADDSHCFIANRNKRNTPRPTFQI